ncbi:MAG: NAD(P)-dependent oxidoreductase [Geminicoccaceae bacterium]
MMTGDPPLLFLDPYPRTEAMVFTEETEAELNGLGRVVSHFGSRAPDGLVEEILPDVTVIIGQTAMPKERLDRARKLQAILNVKANWEPNIDYAQAEARGIHVLSAAPAMAPAVAEAVLGHAINLGRGLIEANQAFRDGSEAYGIGGNQQAYSLYDAEVGLIGYGNLAKALVPLLRPFGCRIKVHDPWLSSDYLEQEGVISVELDRLLAESRYLFLLAGVTSENEGFLNRDRLETIQRDASVILASRAEIVDFQSLLDLGQARKIRLAVDVFPEEPVTADATFRAYDKVQFTPHLAGGIWASYARIRAMMVDDIRQILAGHPPLHMQRAVPGQAEKMRSR